MLKNHGITLQAKYNAEETLSVKEALNKYFDAAVFLITVMCSCKQPVSFGCDVTVRRSALSSFTVKDQDRVRKMILSMCCISLFNASLYNDFSLGTEESRPLAADGACNWVGADIILNFAMCLHNY